MDIAHENVSPSVSHSSDRKGRPLCQACALTKDICAMY